jgi:hypothetical protein
MGSYHTVRQGECIASIAKHYRFTDYHTIYDDRRNALLRSRRPNPNMLRPGDRVYIPDHEERQEERGTGARHRFETSRYQVRLRLVIKDDEGNPYAGKRYELDAGGDSARTGTTNDRGLIEQTIPADLQEAELRIWLGDATIGEDPYEWRLRIGHLDPVETNEGVQARLNNLFYPCGGVDGVLGTNTREALITFQSDEELDETGRADSATRDRLEQRHDVL